MFATSEMPADTDTVFIGAQQSLLSPKALSIFRGRRSEPLACTPIIAHFVRTRSMH
jgi:hypothetical protein